MHDLGKLSHESVRATRGRSFELKIGSPQWPGLAGTLTLPAGGLPQLPQFSLKEKRRKRGRRGRYRKFELATKANG